ncbi:MAG TPA: alkaline phosphatase family protein [Polyangiaceae bacterium]|nr:alkaline phosphatase family protein [Polyangiaceae bacterium]
MSRLRTVFVILLENKVWSELEGSADAPYLNRELLPRASVADGYRAPLEGRQHPSEPNYVWLEAGDNLGIHDDEHPAKNHRSEKEHLVTLLDAARISWRSYQEDIPGDRCPLEPVGMYAPKHNPMVFFDDVTDGNDPRSARCIGHVRPLAELETDLAKGTTPRYAFVTPNQCNDMHTACDPDRNPIRQGDRWLAEWMPKIFASAAYRDGGVVFLTWDEAEVAPSCLLGDCPFGLLAFSPLAKGGGFTTHRTYDHSSLLRTVQEIFGVRPFLGHAKSAESLAELFTAYP